MTCGPGMAFGGFRSPQTDQFGVASTRRPSTGGDANYLFMEVVIGLMESGYLMLEPGYGRLIQVGVPSARQINPITVADYARPATGSWQ